jgi:hypothetical protein
MVLPWLPQEVEAATVTIEAAASAMVTATAFFIIDLTCYNCCSTVENFRQMRKASHSASVIPSGFVFGSGSLHGLKKAPVAPFSAFETFRGMAAEEKRRWFWVRSVAAG